MTRREGTHLIENTLRETGLRPRGKARSEVETAVELEELPKTSEGMREGKIPYDMRAWMGEGYRWGWFPYDVPPFLFGGFGVECLPAGRKPVGDVAL